MIARRLGVSTGFYCVYKRATKLRDSSVDGLTKIPLIMGTDWNDPSVLATEYSILIKMQYTLCGLYIWELLLGLRFDWLLLKRQDQRPWSTLAKWLYLACRYAPMMTLTTIFVGFQAPAGTNCKVWVICLYIIGSLAIECSSALIAIRVFALWNRSSFTMALSAIALAVQASSWIYQLIKADAIYQASTSGCAPTETRTNRVYITVTFLIDLGLLCAMFVGLARRRNAHASGSNMWRILWHQGLIWLTLATLAEVPTVTFLWLNLNQIMNLMFFSPEWMILAIAAARMYRVLMSHFATSAYGPRRAYDTPPYRDAYEASQNIPLRPLHTQVRGLKS
ncbi:unnamed protein product [Peniophora sp. CBMAI 1063]|nr:unnamed protein product [Peniophora sp. CBMAI 1063]